MKFPPISEKKDLPGYTRHTYRCSLCEHQCTLHINFAPGVAPDKEIKMSEWKCGARLKHRGEKQSAQYERERSRAKKAK